MAAPQNIATTENPAQRTGIVTAGKGQIRGEAGQCKRENRGGEVRNSEATDRSVAQAHR